MATWSTFEGTLMILFSYFMLDSSCHSSCRVTLRLSKVLQLTVAIAVLHHMRPTESLSEESGCVPVDRSSWTWYHSWSQSGTVLEVKYFSTFTVIGYSTKYIEELTNHNMLRVQGVETISSQWTFENTKWWWIVSLFRRRWNVTPFLLPLILPILPWGMILYFDHH